jgi:hypothetical protein
MGGTTADTASSASASTGIALWPEATSGKGVMIWAGVELCATSTRGTGAASANPPENTNKLDSSKLVPTINPNNLRWFIHKPPLTNHKNADNTLSQIFKAVIDKNHQLKLASLLT